MQKFILPVAMTLVVLACNIAPGPTEEVTATDTSVPVTETLTPPPPTETVPPSPTNTPTETPTPSPSPIPTVASLKAGVTAELLSCRYGPGPEYLYLFALRQTANIVLVGRVPITRRPRY
jgi:hypothetical protein